MFVAPIAMALVALAKEIEKIGASTLEDGLIVLIAYSLIKRICQEQQLPAMHKFND